MTGVTRVASPFGPVPTRAGWLPLVLMSDADRLSGDTLLAAIAQLPPGALVILRQRGGDWSTRLREAQAVRRACRAQRAMLLVAGDARLARAVGADGVHWPERRARLGPARPWPRALATCAAHGVPGLVAARRIGADAVLLSPVFATRSHPGAAPLGIVRWGLARRTGGCVPVLALGGVTCTSAGRLRGLHPDGYAAIDGWIRS
jgi:thiamine-phosphate pyrophosphorylase